MTWWFLATILSWLIAVDADVAPQDKQSVLEDIRADAVVPALAAGIVREGHFEADFVGVRKIGADVPVEKGDQYHLGSLTKAMTATLIGMLVDQGKLGWKTTLLDLLPERAETMDAGHHATTVEMLAAHRSGIIDTFNQDEEFLQALYDPGLSPVEGRKLIMDRTLREPPGSLVGEFVYSNTNYVILGRAVENLMNGQLSWENNIKEHLFQPLGMDCGFGTPPESSETSVENPWGHVVEKVSEPPEVPTPMDGPLIQRDNPPAICPAGTVHCDSESYSIFTRLHLDGALGLPNNLGISHETFKYLHTPYPPTPKSPAPYTPGAWVYNDGSITPWSNGPWLSHQGSNRAHYAESIIAPGLGETRMAFTNVGNAIEGNGTVPASAAVLEVFSAMVKGVLFPREG